MTNKIKTIVRFETFVNGNIHHVHDETRTVYLTKTGPKISVLGSNVSVTLENGVYIRRERYRNIGLGPVT